MASTIDDYKAPRKTSALDLHCVEQCRCAAIADSDRCRIRVSWPERLTPVPYAEYMCSKNARCEQPHTLTLTRRSVRSLKRVSSAKQAQAIVLFSMPQTKLSAAVQAAAIQLGINNVSAKKGLAALILYFRMSKLQQLAYKLRFCMAGPKR